VSRTKLQLVGRVLKQAVTLLSGLKWDGGYFLRLEGKPQPLPCFNWHSCAYHCGSYICRCGAGRVSASAISPDGRYVACIGGSQGRVRLYQLQPQQQQPVDQGSEGGGV